MEVSGGDHDLSTFSRSWIRSPTGSYPEGYRRKLTSRSAVSLSRLSRTVNSGSAGGTDSTIHKVLHIVEQIIEDFNLREDSGAICPDIAKYLQGNGQARPFVSPPEGIIGQTGRAAVHSQNGYRRSTARVNDLTPPVQHLHERHSSYRARQLGDAHGRVSGESAVYSGKSTSVQGGIIPWRPQIKYLGFILDSRVNWGAHIHRVLDRGHQMSGTLYPLLIGRGKLDPSRKIKIYKAVLTPIITLHEDAGVKPLIDVSCHTTPGSPGGTLDHGHSSRAARTD
ncbi:hypothetical protein Trydic_g7236 [Trypoxylus dichotomus]